MEYFSTYLSSFTFNGYTSLFQNVFNPCSDEKIYILQGASEQTRTYFVEKLSEIISKEGFMSENIVSCYDDRKKEGVIFHDIDTYVIDGKKENNVSGIIFDCNEYIVNLSQACDRKELYERRKEFFSLYDCVKKHESRCQKFLCAAYSMQEDTQRLIGKSLNAEKLEKFITRFVRKEFGSFSEKSGKISKRFLTSLNLTSCTTLIETVKQLCSRIYILDDKYDVVSDALINQLKDAASVCGFDVILFLDHINSERARHIIIPELSLCFFTSDDLVSWTDEYTRKISFTRFVDREIIKKHKNRLRFNSNAVKELVYQASINVSEIKKIKRKTDEIYDQCTDKDLVDELVEKTADEILSSVKL